MRISTHNGLEVWLEWRPASSLSTKDAGEVHEWTRLSERPPRVIAGEVLVTKGAVEIDVDTLAGHREIEYRLRVKQSNYHDWERDLRIEIKSQETVLGVVYLLPGEDHETHCTLAGWSPISQDDLAAALASKPGMSDIIPPDLPELNGGVDEEALNALFEADIATTEIQGSPVEEPENSPDVVLDEGPETDPIEAVLEPAITQTPNQRSTGSSLEIIVSRGQHTALPPTPQPDYVERDIASGLYNGLRRLLFGGDDDNRDEWSPEDAEGVAWCKFVYEVSTDSPQAPTSGPFILDSKESAQLLVELDKYAQNVEIECSRKQEEERRAAKRKIEEDERERLEEIERKEQEEAYWAAVAAEAKERRSIAAQKGWKTRFDRGDFKQKHPHSASTLKLRPDSRHGHDFHHQNGPHKRSHHKKREVEHGHDARAGPSRPTAISGRSDHRRNVDSACDVRDSPEPVSKPLKRSRSYISDGGQIVLPPRSARDDYDTPPPRAETKAMRRIRQIDEADKVQITRPALNEYDTPPPPRLHLNPLQAPQEGVRPRDNGDRKPERPNRVERNGTYLNRARSSGLRRTDDPSGYGLPVLRYPRKRGYGRGESAGSSHRRNLRRLDRPEDRGLPRLSRDEPTREQEERQVQERRLAQREPDKREERQRRDARKRREEREVRERREAREKLVREEAEARAEEEEERNLGPMEEQIRALEERKYQRDVKRAQVQRREERKRLRRVQGSEGHPIVVPERPAKREDKADRPVGRGSRLSVRGVVIDMTELSD